MENLSYNSITLRGEISRRILTNYARMESKYYNPDFVFKADTGGWSGDWEGRTMLALISLAQITGNEPSFLEIMIDNIEKHLNSRGYLGKELPKGETDEQQLSGHNWLLSALLEYYLWKQDDRVLNTIHNIINNLYLPAIGHYKDYPIDVHLRTFNGTYDGKITGNSNKWYTSSDIGCAFMCLDVLSTSYALFKIPELKVLLDEMIDVFKSIDFIGLSMQTHATLSATRGIITLYNTTKDDKYLKIAVNIFDLYLKEGMTENYANKNWFNRPCWTEPCAIVDSLICAIELFKITKEIRYLELGHKIYYNAMGHAQRPNGGFGCDVCCGYDTEFIKHHGEGMCEAFWCCNMRGAVGLSYYGLNHFAADEECLYILNYSDSEIRYRGVKITQKTKYPEEGNVKFLIDNEANTEFKIKNYIPSYVSKAKIIVNEKDVSVDIDNGFVELIINSEIRTIEICFDIPLIKNDAMNKQFITKRYSYNHGLLMLGCHTATAIRIDDIKNLEKVDKAKYQIKDTSVILSRIDDLLDLEVELVVQENRQVLFLV